MAKSQDPGPNPGLEELIALEPFDDPQVARLVGMVMALAGEVFVLKAEVQRLTAALESGGSLDADGLAEAGRSEAVQAWLSEEQRAFATEVLRPWLAPDPVADARPFMAAR